MLYCNYNKLKQVPNSASQGLSENCMKTQEQNLSNERIYSQKAMLRSQFKNHTEKNDSVNGLASGGLYNNLQKCLELRNLYISKSSQSLKDNPRNQDSWEVYPPYKTDDCSSSTEDLQEPTFSKGNPLGSVGLGFNLNHCRIPSPHGFSFKMGDDGIFAVEDQDKYLYSTISFKQFCKDLDFVINTVNNRPTKSFSFNRLLCLDHKWELYSINNEFQELEESKMIPHRDFYNVRKVDTHIHHTSFFKGGKYFTLNEIFEDLGLTAYGLSIDILDMHAHKGSFHRFDHFDLKYNPAGESILREIFMYIGNYIKGRYLAEISREVISDLERSKYQAVEYRISISGKSVEEWTRLAKWVVNHKLFSSNVRWLIQVPRIYHVYKKSNIVKNFNDIIVNLFQPLFEVTHNPSQHPELHIFLQRLVGFDTVGDESTQESLINKDYPNPKEWTSDSNPPYNYYIYYLYANIAVLNRWRKKRGLSTFVLRPHSGEAGDPTHMAAAFLTSQGISHGILLRKVPALQYLYYLAQIGIAMSPVSNNALFLTLERSPFLQFFRRGLNVSLSTDDPLQFHFTKEPLMEEYSIAARVWNFSSTDMCELARNSVIQSGWEDQIKKHWNGENWSKFGVESNDVQKTNVPNVRIKFRYRALQEELDFLSRHTNKLFSKRELPLR